MIRAKTIEERKKELELEIAKLDNLKKTFISSDTFKLSTNTAYLRNAKIFDSWDNFQEFIAVKHDQHWAGECSSEVEVTFKILPLKKRLSE
jgi:hypothetical protein